MPTRNPGRRADARVGMNAHPYVAANKKRGASHLVFFWKRDPFEAHSFLMRYPESRLFTEIATWLKQAHLIPPASAVSL